MGYFVGHVPAGMDRHRKRIAGKNHSRQLYPTRITHRGWPHLHGAYVSSPLLGLVVVHHSNSVDNGTTHALLCEKRTSFVMYDTLDRIAVANRPSDVIQ